MPPPTRQSSRIPGPARRTQIIEVAAALFSERGFSGTTTRQIAECVGVSEAIIFKHFATKEGLYTAILEAKAQTEEIMERVAPLSAARDDAVLFTTLATEIIERTQADPTLMRLLLFSALEGHALAEPFFRSRLKQINLFVSRYIRDRVAAGAFRGVDPLQAAWNFMGMLTHHLLLRELFHQKPPHHLTTERIAREIVATFLHGIQRPARGRR